jgi:hypothetical protein
MKLFLDTKARRFVKSAASNVALQTLVLKRRDQVPLEVVFVENGVAVSPVLGTQTTIALKSSFSDSNFLALAAPGTNTLDLYTEPVEDAFSSDPASIAAFLEIRWTAPTQALRTATLQVEVQNSVILGDEATPAALPDGKATQAEAEAGTDNTKWMTPLRTAQAITALADATFYGNAAPDPAQFTQWVHTDLGRLFTWFKGVWVEFTHSTAAGMGSTAWAEITGKPLTFAPSTHTHAIADTTGLNAALAGKVSGSGVASISVVQSLPATLVPTTFYIVVPSGATTASAVQLGSVSLFTGDGGGDDGGGGGGEPPAWAPTTLANLALWLDATSGLFDATTGGAAVTANGAQVARWEDRSGNARHFSQATVNSRPTLATAGLNSKATLYFDGTDDFLDATYSRPYAAQTFFVVFAINTAKSQGALFTESEAGVTDVSIYTAAVQRTTEVGSFADGASTTRSAKIYTLGAYCIGTFSHSGSQILNYLNAVPGAAFADTFPSVEYNVARGRISGRINAGGSLNAPGANSIGEVIAYDRLLTTTERDTVHAYLSTKWGITL